MGPISSRLAWGIALLLCLAVVPVAEARDDSGQQGGDASTGYSSGYVGQSQNSSNVIGYQPIPNSALQPATGMQQQYGAQQQFGAPQQQYAMAPGQAQIAGTQPAIPLGRTPGSGYEYTLYMVGNGPYTLGRDDVISIDVRNQPEFSGPFVIGPDGSIQYNYIGDIPIAGMTKYEVQQVITKLLERYIRAPVVTVAIMAYNSKAVYVIGEVNRPGKYIMRGDVIKLREAIVAAGLPTRTAAMRRTHIVKPDLDNPSIRKINLKKILYKGNLKDDIDLYPGEIIVVPSTVLASVNRFLSDLLNPVTRAATAATIGVGI